MTKIKLAIVEDHPIVTKALKLIVTELVQDIQFLELKSYEEMKTSLKEEKDITHCIADLQLEDGFAFETLEECVQENSSITFMIYSAMPERYYAQRLIKTGVLGFVNKQTHESELKFALSCFFNNRFYMSQELKKVIVRSTKEVKEMSDDPLLILSNREMAVLEHLTRGLTLKEVAQKLNIKSNTASTLRKRAFEKLNIHTLADAIKLYQANRLI